MSNINEFFDFEEVDRTSREYLIQVIEDNFLKYKVKEGKSYVTFKNSITCLLKYNNHKELIKDIYEIEKQVREWDSTVESYSEIIFRYYYNIKERPVCLVCGGFVNYRIFNIDYSDNTGYRSVCGIRCKEIYTGLKNKTSMKGNTNGRFGKNKTISEEAKKAISEKIIAYNENLTKEERFLYNNHSKNFSTLSDIHQFYIDNCYKPIDFDNEYAGSNNCIYCLDTQGYYVKKSLSNIRREIKNKGVKSNILNDNIYALHNLKLLLSEYYSNYIVDDSVTDEDILNTYSIVKFKYIGYESTKGQSKVFEAPIWHVKQMNLKHPAFKKSTSIGEELVSYYLTENKIKFKSEKTFKNLRYEKKLRYDFYLPDHNTIIEFHGKQHYEYIEFLHGTKKNFEKHKLRDQIKVDYCNDNNIKLIVIPYYEMKNISKILEKEIYKN